MNNLLGTGEEEGVSTPALSCPGGGGEPAIPPTLPLPHAGICTLHTLPGEFQNQNLRPRPLGLSEVSTHLSQQLQTEPWGMT